jgi:large subunit ribosomal protein L9
MDVILLQRIAKLGQMGDTVRVKNGYARNFLLPTGKALRATEANKKRFAEQKVELEARNLEHKSEATAVTEKLAGQSFTIIRQAGEAGHLYGSVSARDIAEAVTAGGFNTGREQIVLRVPIKAIGLHPVPVHLHPEVECMITVNVARSPEEAERQAKGETLVVVQDASMQDLGLDVGAALAEANDEANDEEVQPAAAETPSAAPRPRRKRAAEQG